MRCLDLDVEIATGVRIEKNRFVAKALTNTYRAHALQWTSGVAAGASDIVVRGNVFVSTDRMINRAWGSARGGVLAGNAWRRDLSQGPGHPFLFEFFDTSDAQGAPGHRVLDAVTAENVNAIDQWNAPGPYAATREWSLTIAAVDGSGAPVAGAAVSVRDAFGALAFSGTTDAAGLSMGTLVGTRIANGPSVIDQGPFAATVSKAGVGAYAGDVAVTKTTALRVDLAAGTAATDVTPPAAPTNVTRRALSASRGHVQWSPVVDPSGIAGYLVLLDGEPVGLTDETRFVVSGLAPLATASVTIQALDRGGNASPPSAAVSITTPAEDRGP